MATTKRIFLFLSVNLAVMASISLLLAGLGVGPWLTSRGIDLGALMAFCLVWGFAGALVSLLLSRVAAKRMMRVRVIDPARETDPVLRELVETVHALSRAAGLPRMPEVGVYASSELNAFATGPTRSRALVAVSSGLLQRMGRAEVEGVLAHEVAHVANGDMVTMTLVQGVVNAFVMFLARVVAFGLAQASRGRDEGAGLARGVQPLLVFALELVFMVLGSLVVAAYSRHREFRADRGGARLAGADKMAAALRALQRQIGPAAGAPAAVAALQIARPAGWLALFSTHPPLEERIRRVEGGGETR
jgi:heat shock protein HtpX